MRHWWQEKRAGIRAWFAGRMRERVTLAGLGFLAALALVGFAAFASANNLLFLLLAAMLATLLVSGFVSRMGLAALELDIQLPDHICARRRVPARILLHNEKTWLPSFSIRLVGTNHSVFTTDLYYPVIPGGGTLETTVDVSFARRGVHAEESFLFSTRFPFGFAERRTQVTMKHDMLIYPALDPRPGFERLLAEVAGDAESLFRGRGHDFYRIRPYQQFESARHVDWRATAHTGSLQVREFAREEEPLIVLFLDLEVPQEDEAWFEQALECCAFLAWHFASRGARILFRTQDFEAHVPAASDVYAILKYLALVQCRPGAIPLANLEQRCVSVVFSASPRRLRNCGWDHARLLEPSSPLWAEPSA
jgi:uncharacterized protein (DUF58 family)